MSNKNKKNLMQLKTEFAEETGVDISQYNHLNKGSLTSRQNGYVGGYIGGTMTKKLVEMAEEQLAGEQRK
ncbi:MAG: alpha/beta-type small acid-soluble spore protein [Eubacteriales bacterium]|nr:alpha/beta-type small acid-soluble spore protein [Eubacteriales bacterium]